MLTQAFLRASRYALQIVAAVPSRLLPFRHAHNKHAHSQFKTVKTLKTTLYTVKLTNGVVPLAGRSIVLHTDSLDGVTTHIKLRNLLVVYNLHADTKSEIILLLAYRTLSNYCGKLNTIYCNALKHQVST